MKTALMTAVLSLMVLSLGCESVQPQAEKTEKKTPTWSSKMAGLAANVHELTPFIYSKKDYYQPENREKIKKALNGFSEDLHEISPEMGKKFLGPDPLLKYSLDRLTADVERASEAFELGQLEYSRGTMKTVLNHCFRCHTMKKMDVKAQWDIAAAFKNLEVAPLEKVDLLIAGRKYDAAIARLESLLEDREFVQAHPFRFEDALRKYLAIMIRVKESPEPALHELDELSEREEIPFYLQEQIASWKSSLLDWSREKKNKKAGEKSLLSRAQERIAEGRQLQQFEKDHAGDVEFLRATTLLHDALAEAKNPKEFAKIYHLLGVAYEVLDELGYWNLHEIYYEACVRTLPKSDLARTCFRRLQSSVYLGYSGSSGVNIPANERQRLNELEKLIK